MCEEIDYGIIERIENPNEYKEFKTGEEAEKWGKAIYEKWSHDYIKFQINKKESGMFETDSWAHDPIRWYCGWGYKGINRYLRNKENEGLERDKYRSVMLSEVILTAPKIPENIIVYRYVSNMVIDKLIKANKEKEHHYYYEKGFVSTSLLRNIALQAPENSSLLKIYVDQNVLGIYVNTVVARDEFELLIQNNLFIRLCEKPKWDDELKMMIYECKAFSFAFK